MAGQLDREPQQTEKRSLPRRGCQISSHSVCDTYLGIELQSTYGKQPTNVGADDRKDRL